MCVSAGIDVFNQCIPSCLSESVVCTVHCDFKDVWLPFSSNRHLNTRESVAHCKYS